MSLTVLDVTVRSTVIIVLTLFTFWLITKARTIGDKTPLIVRVDNHPTQFVKPQRVSHYLKSGGLLTISGLLIGLIVAVVVSSSMSLLVARLFGSLGK